MSVGRGDAEVARAVAEVAAGRPVVVLDDEDREAEGDLVLAAAAATPEWLTFFVRHGTGLVCVPMADSWADRLGLPLMVADNEESMRTAFTVTVDARHGLGTGVSAADRSRTARLLAHPGTTPGDLVRPGHLLPLRARPGGVLERRGHTEAAVDLARLAGTTPVGLIVELVDDDGSMRRAASCRELAAEHGLAVLTVDQLARHLGQREHRPSPPTAAPGVRRVATTVLPTAGADFTAHGYRDSGGAEHLALVLGDVTSEPPVPVRVHSECLTGDVLGSLRCDCGPQLAAALATVAAEGRGIVVYLRGHEGRGIGLAAKLAAYALQDAGRDTVEANEDLGLPVDARDFRTAAQVLTDLGVGPVRLLTNNPAKVDALSSAGVRVVARSGLLVPPTAHNERYLRTKQRRLGHHLPQLDGGHRADEEEGTPR